MNGEQHEIQQRNMANFRSIAFCLVLGIANNCAIIASELSGTDDSPAVGKIPILVVDDQDRPISGVKLVPWALGSGQYHGLWGTFEGKPDVSGMNPISEITDKDGTAEILYPILRDAKEKVKTLSVSVRFEHLHYACGDTKHIDVPLPDDGPYKVVMTATASIDLKPLIDGKAVHLDEVYALWSNSRSWRVEGAPEKLASGHLRIHGFMPGENRVLLVRMVDDSITHFTEVLEFNATAGGHEEQGVALVSPSRIVGTLSDNVPRPVRQGRVVARTLPKQPDGNNVTWMDWAEVSADGSFKFEAWPATESIQLIALCDGYIATSGNAPTEDLKQPKDPYYRPHTFPAGCTNIVVPMKALSPVTVTITDGADAPIKDMFVAASPNVGWWNYGSQIYADSTAKGKNVLKKRNGMNALDKPFPSLFEGNTDSRGSITLQLPAGTQYIAAWNDQYELPISLGSRDAKIRVREETPLDVKLRAQPLGTEQLGDWDRLAGVVYGCSTIEGRKLLELPGMKEKVDDFVRKFSDAKNQQDPELLSEAYLSLSEAFQNANEQEEALKWKMKAFDLKKK